MSFINKVVIVTGGSSGIGAKIAEQFSDEGARVVIVGRNINNLNDVAARCPNVYVIAADITNTEDAKRIVQESKNKFGKIDILINNAGSVHLSSILDVNILKSYDETMDVKVRAVIHLTSLVAPHLKETKGNIINISGVGVRINNKHDFASSIPLYIAEAALDQITLCSASELAPYGVRVNAVSPGPVRTPLLKGIASSFPENNLKKGTALNRISDPEEIANVVLFLASEKAKGITGSNYDVDNGFLLRN